MNIFEFTAIASPLAGAIAGGMAGKNSGFGWMILGTGSGFLVGLALYFAAISLSSLFARYCTAEKLNPLQWLASVSGSLDTGRVTLYGVDALFVVRLGIVAPIAMIKGVRNETPTFSEQ